MVSKPQEKELELSLQKLQVQGNFFVCNPKWYFIVDIMDGVCPEKPFFEKQCFRIWFQISEVFH